MTKTQIIKSNEIRRDWAEVLQYVRTGGTVVVEHYNRPIATIAPYVEETAMQSTQDIADQVTTTLGDRAADFDVDALVEDLILNYGRVNVDSIDSGAYWKLVAKHDTTA